MLRDGDSVGTDDDGRTALMLMLDSRTLDRLLAFDADAAELEDPDGEPEPVLQVVPTKRRGRVAQAVAVALLLVAAPSGIARADQAPVVTPLPTSTAQAPEQCCRVCRKGKACGDACISATKQCKKEHGCACSAASGS